MQVRSELSMWFCPAALSPLPLLPQMLGVGLGSVAAVVLLVFLSFSAVWYVRLSFLRNERNGGDSGVGAMQNSWGRGGPQG